MNSKLLVVVLILSGGMFSSDIDDNEEEKPESVVMNNRISELFSDRYDIGTYLSICDKLMYVNGQFYSEQDVAGCRESVHIHYEEEMNRFDRPDFEFFTVGKTEYRAKYSEDIYKIDLFGIYCNGNSLTDIVMDSKKCSTEDIGSLYMAKHSASGEWGYAGKGFETTNGKYLKVVRP